MQGGRRRAGVVTAGSVSLVKLVEDGGLEPLDNAGLVGFLQGFERFRNRLPLVDHQASRPRSAGTWPLSCASQPAAVVAATLRISIGEANGGSGRRALAGRMSMTGQPLEPVRPHWRRRNATGRSAPDRSTSWTALAKVDRAGARPGRRRLGGTSGSPARPPRSGRRPAPVGRAGRGRHRPRRHPPRRPAAGRPAPLPLPPTRDGGYAGEFRLTAEAGAKLQAALGPLAKPRINTAETADGPPVEEPDPRTTGSGCMTPSKMSVTGCSAPMASPMRVAHRPR